MQCLGANTLLSAFQRGRGHYDFAKKYLQRPVLICLLITASFGGVAAAVDMKLEVPIECQVGSTCFIQNYVDRDPTTSARDYMCSSRTYDAHNGTDFRLPSLPAIDVPILAAANGRVSRMRDGILDIALDRRDTSAVSGIECGNGIVIQHEEGFETQYCHLKQGSIRVQIGDEVRVGQPLASVGLSGQTEYPHLHFTVRRRGTVIDPFASDPSDMGCNGHREGMWSDKARTVLTYRATEVINCGFTDRPVSSKDLDKGVAPIPLQPAAVIAYCRTIGLKAGDVQKMSIHSSNGDVSINHIAPAVIKDMAEQVLYVGKKRPPTAWRGGVVTAEFSIVRRGVTVLTKAFSFGM